MSRLPFDPSRAFGAPDDTPSPGNGERPELGPAGASGGSAGRKRYPNIAHAAHLTVTQVNELIRSTLEQRIASPLRVIGQVSNLSARNHWYFSLKDDGAVLHCVAWATAVKKFGFTPKDGDEVIATGHVSHYAPQGRTQFYVDGMMPVGAGALELKFRALCDELRALGYFEEPRKKTLPVFPRKIAVITSQTGAAIHDVITTAAQRCKAIGLVLIDVKVQGDGAAEDVARAIRWVDRNHARLGVDAMLVTRGGGSIEDLWAFNERIVADAVYRCTIPVVAAIGHESDTTIIELVADVRASTPTQAAMKLIPSSAELCKHIDHVVKRLGFLVGRVMERQRRRLDELGRREWMRNPQRVITQARRERLAASGRNLRQIVVGRISHQRARLERLTSRLAKLQPTTVLAQREAKLSVLRDRLRLAMLARLDQRPRLQWLQRGLASAVTHHFTRVRDWLLTLERELDAMDPHSILRRGYSLTMHRGGAIVRSSKEVQSGDEIITRLDDGTIDSVVAGSAARGRATTPKLRRRPATSPDQLDLFGGGR